MDIWNSVFGMVEVELTSADITQALHAINAAGIVLYHTGKKDDLTFVCRIRRSDFLKLKTIAEKRGERLSFVQRNGFYWVLHRLLSRPILLFGTLVLVLLSLYLPTRILFIRVEGNHVIPDRRILFEAEGCGLGFGVLRKDIRSEKLKNSLLQAIPQLQWAGVNTYGCTAVICVQERVNQTEPASQGGICSIVASRDGVISEMTVLQGNPLCKVGQAVKAGQVLVSGYKDCGIYIRACHAEAEIFAETQRDLSAVIPANYSARGEKIATEKKYRLIIGKKQINFFKDSGISGVGCDKMYTKYYLTLPGDFQLPIGFVVEEWTYSDQMAVQMEEEMARDILQSFSGEHLAASMVAGQILNKQERIDFCGDYFCQSGQYACVEMIGMTRLEEKLCEDEVG